MNNWPYRPVSDFLAERTGKYKPNDPVLSGYKRLEKIDFSGQIHLSDKSTKTNMIIVEPGDLVISGINVAKGALAVYEGEEPVVATIHYSSYMFDRNKIDIDFLKRFLKSPTFITELQNQVKGGIKTEIKPKHLLPLNVRVPNISDQKRVNLYFDSIENEISDLSNEVINQSFYLIQLRQAILQEAIEGKLTADWRKENPVRKGDPDYDAKALLDKIKAEKEKLLKEGKIKKQKMLPPINPEDVPFQLPEGWVWTRLGEICDFITKGTTPAAHELKARGDVPYLKVYNIVNQEIDFYYRPQYISHDVHDRLSRSKVYPDDVLMNIVGPPLGKVAIIPENFPEWNINQALAIFRCVVKDVNHYIYYHLLEGSCIFSIQTLGVVGQDNISLEQSRNILLPLPSLKEQRVIVDRVERLFSMVDDLEKQVSERKEQSEQLMQAVLREAFEGDK